MFQRIFRGIRSKRKYDVNTILKEGAVFEVDCWVISEILLDRVIPIIGIHPYPLNEQMLMAAAVAFVQPGTILEWGTHFGKSARLFWEVKEAMGMDCRIYSIDSMDPDHPEYPGRARGKFLSHTDVEQIVGDGLEVALKRLDDTMGSRPVLIYIDGDHSQGAVKRDLSVWSKLPYGSGLLAHDVFYQNPSNYNIGPWDSFQDFLREEGSTISQEQWQLLGLPGMVFVSKKGTGETMAREMK